MGDLSKNFSRSEFECECGCGFDTVDFELLGVLQDIADHFKARVFITGPNRCKEHNEVVQKVYNPDYIPYTSSSTHMKAKAADIVVEGVTPGEVAGYLQTKYPDKYGIGIYSNRNHVDVSHKKRRWVG